MSPAILAALIAVYICGYIIAFRRIVWYFHRMEFHERGEDTKVTVGDVVYYFHVSGMLSLLWPIMLMAFVVHVIIRKAQPDRIIRVVAKAPDSRAQKLEAITAMRKELDRQERELKIGPYQD